MKMPSWLGGDPARDQPARIVERPQGGDAASLVERPVQARTASVARRRGRAPLTQERLNELLTILLKDVHAWSAEYGYENVPPIEILRQTIRLGEAVGYAQGRDGVDF